MADINQGVVAARRVEQTPKFVFKSCCFCIPLKTGCLILAYLYLIGTILNLVYASLGLTFIITMSLRYNHGMSPALVAFTVVIAITIVLILAALPLNILLLIGLHKEKRKYVKIFLIFQLVNTILNIVLRIIELAVATDGQATGIASTLFYVVITVYYLLVMRSQYVKMGEDVKNLPDQLYKDGRIVTPMV